MPARKTSEGSREAEVVPLVANKGFGTTVLPSDCKVQRGARQLEGWYRFLIDPEPPLNVAKVGNATVRGSSLVVNPDEQEIDLVHGGLDYLVDELIAGLRLRLSQLAVQATKGEEARDQHRARTRLA